MILIFDVLIFKHFQEFRRQILEIKYTRNIIPKNIFHFWSEISQFPL